MNKIFFRVAALMLLLSALEVTALHHLTASPEFGSLAPVGLIAP